MPEKKPGKIYRSQAEAVVKALEGVFVEGRYADKVIEYILRQDRRRGSSDRAFIADTVYGVVRYKRLYQEITGVERINGPHACWRLMAAHVVVSGGTLPPWEEFSKISPEKIISAYQKCRKVRKVRESIPDWLDRMGMDELPDVWEAEISALNTQAPVVLRVNTLKTDMASLRRALAGNGIVGKDVPGCPDALELVTRKNVFDTDAFRVGMFEVQDASSQKVSALLDPRPGMRVVDACAGAGGKTLHISALMEGKGTITAMDIFSGKLEELKKRARRAGASNITPKVIEGSKTIKRMKESADRLLLDVPCSGLGVLRRNPDAKWKLTPEFIDSVTQTQAEILSSYSAMLKPGGRMVYSTCSVLPRENGMQVARFLTENSGYKLLEEHSLLASRDGYDGFYMALIERGQ